MIAIVPSRGPSIATTPFPFTVAVTGQHFPYCVSFPRLLSRKSAPFVIQGLGQHVPDPQAASPGPKMSTTAPTSARHIVNFITGNKNKLVEVKAILEPAIQVENQALDLKEVQGTLEEVTLDKCRAAADLVRLGSQAPSSTSLLENAQLMRCKGPRSRASGRHVPVLQCPKRTPRSLHVSISSRPSRPFLHWPGPVCMHN